MPITTILGAILIFGGQIAVIVWIAWDTQRNLKRQAEKNDQ